LSTFEIVECGWPVQTVSRRGPQPVWRLAAQIRRCSRTGSRRGIRCGRLERSNKQPSERRSCSLAPCQRHDQRLTVAGETLKRLATSRTGNPRSRACTSAKRPDSPSLALR
jgi:hypothetical protein